MTLQEAEKVQELIAAHRELRTALENLSLSGLRLSSEEQAEVRRMTASVKALTKRLNNARLQAEIAAGVTVIVTK